jgi:hypothetical protein
LNRAVLLSLAALCAALPATRLARSAGPAEAEPRRSLEDYKHFRITAIDLLGRMPTREEIAEFERPAFDYGRWVDAHLGGPAYAERLTRIYMDALRLEPNLNFSSAPAQLYRFEVLGPDGKGIPVYFRQNQRRERPETDGEFCLSPEEVGVVVRPNRQPGTLKKVPQATLDKYTVLVKPWWLYRDYRTPSPTQLYGAGWNDPDPEYKPVDSLLKDDAGNPVTEVRVCREEAERRETGHIYASGRLPPRGGRAAPGTKLLGGRQRPPPVDKPYAIQHQGQEVRCEGKLALDYAPDCGCGVGLERCIPGDSPQLGAAAFYFPNHMPLGSGMPLDDARQQAQRWFPYWWSREAVRFLSDVLEEDRDFREILTSKRTFVNGPLAQFYRTIQRGDCCGPEAALGMVQESDPLFDPRNVPEDLEPSDVSTWKVVENRGPHASGILTMPMFLEKYASARARGAALYNDFLCKSFVADNQQLTASTEPNLMVRPGCKTCHSTLEPLAAYFARVEPSSFVFLPRETFPVQSAACKLDRNGRLTPPCNALYDPAFADVRSATLRSAYGSPEHADATPLGAGQDITRMPEFAQCAVQRVTSSFLGRPTTPDDEALLGSLTSQFVRSGYRMRALVRAIVGSPQYRTSNDLSSESWRSQGGGE